MLTFELRALGPLEFLVDGEPVGSFGSRKVAALLVYLASTEGESSRDQLGALLWPELERTRARRNLSWSLSRLALVAPGLIEASDHLRLQHEMLVSDLEEVRDALAASAPDAMRAALARYRGDFMEGFSIGEHYDLWLAEQRRLWRQRGRELYERLVDHFADSGDRARAIEYAERRVEFDPTDEEGHRRLMRLLAEAGERARAMRQYARCQTLLAERLGVTPAEETTALFNEIAGRALPDAQLPAPRTAPVAAPASRAVPVAIMPFVGRRALLEEIGERLASPSLRWLALVGPGGIGKSRVAEEIARRSADDFAHGATMLSLAGLGDPDRVEAVLADALELTLSGSDPVGDQLARYLAPRSMLVVIDQCDGQSEALARLMPLLKAAPRLRLITTSRQPLGLAGERPLAIHGMSYPAPGEPLTADHDAVALFYRCANRLGVRLATDGPVRHDVVRICRLVGGHPLGIELAATWIRRERPEGIARQIELDMDFLSTAMADVPAEQRSLRAIFDHTWSMLTEAERRACRKLAIFHGGFGEQAAAQICGVSYRLLRRLAERALLAPAGDGRWEMVETLRRYAERRLGVEPGEELVLRDLHGRWHLEKIAARLPELRRVADPATLGWIALESDNFLRAWRWALLDDHIALLLDATEALGRYFERRGRYHEGRSLFAGATEHLEQHRNPLRLPAEPLALLRARLLAWEGRLSLALSDIERAAARLGRAATALERLEQPRELAWVLADLALTQSAGGDPVAARRDFERAITLARDLGENQTLGAALVRLGRLEWRYGRLDHAHRALEEALAVARAGGDQPNEAAALDALGTVYWAWGRVGEAREYFAAGAEILRRLGDPRGLARAVDHLGNAAFELGDFAQAQHHHTEALRLRERTGDRRAIARATDALAITTLMLGERQIAERMIRDALATREQLGEQREIAHSLVTLGHFFNETGQLVEAERTLQRATQRFGQLGDSEGLANAWYQYGLTARYSGRTRDAQRRFEQSLKAHRGVASPLGAARTRVALGQLAAERGMDARAREYLTDALHVALDGPLPSLLLGALLGGATLLRVGGAPARAAEILNALRFNPALDSFQTRTLHEQLDILKAINPQYAVRGTGPLRPALDQLARRLLVELEGKEAR